MKALIIDSENSSLMTLEILLNQFTDIQIVGTHMTLSNDVKESISEEIDIIFIDYFLSDTYQTDFIVQLVQEFPDIQIILMKPHAYHLEERVVSEIQFLSKPIRRYSLKKLMRKIEKKQLHMFHSKQQISQFNQ